MGEYLLIYHLGLHPCVLVCVDLADADALSELHTQIKSCDSILATMESMLSHFQSDLSASSSEIAYLQEKSYGMNVKLRNCQSAETRLNEFIQAIYLPDDLCNLILEGDLNEPFVTGLVELDRKLAHLDRAQSADAPFSLAARDMAPIGLALKLKSLARIRAFLLERFHALKKPKTNIQIKQKLLLKFSYFYQFLLHHADAEGAHRSANGTPALSERSLSGLGSSGRDLYASASGGGGAGGAGSSHPDICGEIRREYHETMSTIYHAKFKKYLAELRKLQADSTVEKGDTLGSEFANSGGSKSSGGSLMGGMLSGMFGAKRATGAIEHVFRLAGREEVLLGAADSTGASNAAADRDLIIPHIAGATVGGKLAFERLFRSSQSLLMDTATSEYDFIVEFFGERMARDMDRAGQHEDEIAAERERVQLEAEAKEELAAVGGKVSTPHSYDQRQSDERGREHLAPHSRDKHLFNLVFGKTLTLFLDHLDAYLFSCHDALGLLVLIRIVCQHNIQMQYRRVHCLDHVFDRMNMMLWPRFKQIFDENVASVMRVAHADIKVAVKPRPHTIGTRYAEFASGILTLNEGYDDDILVANLKRLRGEVDKFLLRSADRYLAAGGTQKHQLVFLLVNYHSILHVLASHRHASSEDAKYWREQAGVQTSKFVEVSLNETFPTLLAFLNAAGAAHAAHERDRTRPYPDSGALAFAKLKEQVQNFHRSWQDGIQRMHADIVRNFTPDAADAASAGSSVNAAGAPSVAASSREHVDEIFMRTLSQLMLYLTQLEQVWRAHYKQTVPVADQKAIEAALITNSTLSIEVKKYRK